MVGVFDSVPVSLLTIILLLVPGLLGLDLYYRITNRKSTLSRIQVFVYSSFFSLGSLFLLYLTTPLYFDFATTGSTAIINSTNIINAEDIGGLNLANGVVLYSLHVVFTGFLGVLGGILITRVNRNKIDRREPWEYAFSVSATDQETIEVVLNDGTIIRGNFNRESWDPDRRELYLDDPHEIRYSMDGDVVSSDIDLGRSILLKEESIHQVIFSEEDPNTITFDQIMDEIEMSGEDMEQIDDLVRTYWDDIQSQEDSEE